MGTGIGIAPSVMINRIVHQNGVPQGGHLLEVARLRAEMMQAQAENAAARRPTSSGAKAERSGGPLGGDAPASASSREGTSGPS